MTNDKFANRNHQNNETGELVYTIGANESSSKAVVKATAAFTNTRVLDLEPLYHAIDPDSIDKIFSSTDESMDDIDLSFKFNGCDIEIDSEKVVVKGEEIP